MTVRSWGVARSIVVLVGLALAASQAQAGLISTDAAVAAQDRERLGAMLQRPYAAKELEKMGIQPHEAQTRVDAMTDEEIRSLAGRLDRLPAGGEVTTPELIMWILLITLALMIG